MTQRTVLLVCQGAERFAQVQASLSGWHGLQLRGVSAVEDALQLLRDWESCLLLIDQAEVFDPEVVSRLLHACSLGRGRTPAVVLAWDYDEAEALSAFRLGAADYLSVRDQIDVLPAVVGRLLASPAAATFTGSLGSKEEGEAADSRLTHSR